MPSVKDRPKILVTPIFSSVFGPSRSSTNSSASSLRKVLPPLIEKSLVMAIPLTTEKYRWRNAWNLRRPTPSASTLRKTKPSCSAVPAFSPSSATARLQRASWAILSSPGFTSSMKYCSWEALFFRISPRMASETTGSKAATMSEHFLWTPSVAALTFLRTVSARPTSFTSSRLASIIAPFNGEGNAFCCSAAASFAASKAATAASVNFATDSLTVNGVAKALTSSAAFRSTNGFAAASTAARAASMASALAFAGARRTSASRCSLAWMCAFRSKRSLFGKSLFAAWIDCFSVCSDDCDSMALPLSFPIWLFACAIELSRPWLDSSDSFAPKKCMDFCTVFAHASTVFSSSSQKPGKGKICLMNFVPWLPCMVTKPVVPPGTTVHSMRIMPLASSVCGPWTVSSISPPSSLPTVLLFATSKPSVTEISFRHLKRCKNMALNSSREILPSPSTSSCLAMPSRLASLKASSSRPKASGAFPT
mmetsp:Transcript_118601/g.342986  ORF Transcript_118601/g.342986 Transcript_118601/m.342986 type:complete len:480 (+) Transcript_118601:1070-2509(+)